jgi:IS30 family transposase
MRSLRNIKQLNQEERFRIAALKCERVGLREIGRRLGRSASTVSREIRRNAYPMDGSYKAAHADRMASGRRKRIRKGSRFTVEEWRKVDGLIPKD